MSIKLNRAIRNANVFKGSVTVDAIMKQIPEQLINNLSSKDLAVVIEAVNKAYHNGRASTGAEMIDTNCVWINNINRLVDISCVDGKYSAKVAPTSEEQNAIYKDILNELKALSVIVDDNETFPTGEFKLSVYPNGCACGEYRDVTHIISNPKGSMAIKANDKWNYHV
jgi:hypothetical protein